MLAFKGNTYQEVKDEDLFNRISLNDFLVGDYIYKVIESNDFIKGSFVKENIVAGIVDNTNIEYATTKDVNPPIDFNRVYYLNKKILYLEKMILCKK